MSTNLIEYFNKQPRLGTLSTADKNGSVNAAFFGSPRMRDERTIVMGCGNNRTFKNLQENPQACFLVMEPGKALPEWRGVRIYVKMREADTSGEQYRSVKAAIAEKVGKEAADRMIYAALVFEVLEVRPLVDMGQGWEKSIG
jgi:hypothetical protein